MNSLDYKLSDTECKELRNCKFEYKGVDYNIDSISYLPYGHLIFVKEKEGYGNSYVLNISNNQNGKDIEISPSEGGLAFAVRKAIQEHFTNHKEYK